MIIEFWKEYDEGKFWENLERINKKHHYLNTVVKSPIRGFPFSVKDLIVTKGVETTASSRILRGWVPKYDAKAVERMRKQGTLIGKNNCDAWGFGSFNANTSFPVPTNPWDEERVTGGSSGGSAGLVAALPEPTISIATSTGGSIENPSSFCGVVGFVPTYGAVPRYGLISYADSLDKIGVIAKNADDAEFGFNIVRGPDGRDMTAIDIEEKAGEVERVGIVREFLDVDSHIRDRFEEIVSDLPYEVVEVSLERTFKYGVMAYYIIAMAEASTNLARYSGLRYGYSADPEGKGFNEYFSKARSLFGEEAKRRIMLGTFVRSAGYRNRYYRKATCIRKMVVEEYKRAFKKADILIHPTMPIVAPKFSEIEKLTPAQTYMMDILTVGPNLAGMPHGSVPIQKSGMPFGMMVNGRWRQDLAVLEFMKEVESLL